jgi:hypothetical protein
VEWFILGLQKFLKLFTSYSHCLPSRPASGLRLEILGQIDKKKSEFYFCVDGKKILTEKAKRDSKKTRNCCAQAKLTEMARARIFSPFGAAGGAPSVEK